MTVSARSCAAVSTVLSGRSVSDTRAAPEIGPAFCGVRNGHGRHARPGGRGGELASGHPARRSAELTAGLLARGSPPVTAFPGETQWHCGTSSPLTVAGAAADLGQVPAPHSLFTLRHEETVNSGPLNDLKWAFVNANAGGCYCALSPCGSRQRRTCDSSCLRGILSWTTTA